MGHFNSKLDGGITGSQIMEKIGKKENKEDISSMLKNDALKRVVDENSRFYGFTEEPIEFPPTFAIKPRYRSFPFFLNRMCAIAHLVPKREVPKNTWIDMSQGGPLEYLTINHLSRIR